MQGTSAAWAGLSSIAGGGPHSPLIRRMEAAVPIR